MTKKVNGFGRGNDQFVSGAMKTFTATVANYDLSVADSELVDGEDNAVYNMGVDALIEAISTRAQPVIMGKPTETTLMFYVEHAEVFGEGDQLAAFIAEVQATFRTKTGADTATVDIA